MSEAIKQLEEHIQQQQEELRAHKIVLAAMKKKQAQDTPFSQTKLGKAWYGTLRTITKPLASLHEDATKNLERPYDVQSERYMKKASKLLKKAKELNREEKEKQSTMMAVMMAEFVMECEDYMERRGVHLQPFFIEDLREEIQRLRPPKDKQRLEEIKQEISKLQTQEA